MKHLILTLLLLLMLVSCSTQKKALTTPVVAKETMETKVVYREVLLHDTLFIEIPSQQAERTTSDSVSFLETDYAESTARINQDGTLFHDLKNKPQKKPIPHDTPVLSKDSIVYVNKEVPTLVPVERELSIWEQVSIRYFKWLLPLLLFAVVWIFKKPILAIVRRFI